MGTYRHYCQYGKGKNTNLLLKSEKVCLTSMGTFEQILRKKHYENFLTKQTNLHNVVFSKHYQKVMIDSFKMNNDSNYKSE